LTPDTQDEKVLIAKAKTAIEANKIFEDLKGKLTKKYDKFPDEDVQCIWCMDYSTIG
jgi:hypothetical protein